MTTAMASGAMPVGSGMGLNGSKLLNAKPRPIVLLPMKVMRTLSTPAGRPENENVHGSPSRAALFPSGEF